MTLDDDGQHRSNKPAPRHLAHSPQMNRPCPTKAVSVRYDSAHPGPDEGTQDGCIIPMITREGARKPMRIRTARLIVCLTVAGLAAGCASSAGPAIAPIDKSFLSGISSYDQNRDGVVTCDEWRAEAASLFAKANKSGSGALTEAEFKTLATNDRIFLEATFKYYDINGDGKVDRKEFVERPNPAFAYADKDKDCRLIGAELITARNLSAPPAEASPNRNPAGPGSATGPSPSSGPGGGGRY
jgi:Ca2+-binding EF-hand superfamily protein